MKNLNYKPYNRDDYAVERSLLAKDMSKLFMSHSFADLTIILGDDHIPAHKFILAAHSSVFAEMLRRDDVTELKIKMDGPKEAYIELFRYIYNGTVKQLNPYLIPLMNLAQEYEVKGLQELCRLEVNRANNALYGRNLERPHIPADVLSDMDKCLKLNQLLREIDELFNGNKNDNISAPPSR